MDASLGLGRQTGHPSVHFVRWGATVMFTEQLSVNRALGPSLRWRRGRLISHNVRVRELIFKWFNSFVYETIVLKIGKCRGLYMYNNDIFFFDCDIIIIKNNWFLWLCKGRVECKSLVAIC